jgi:uncharacterized protein YbaR (Trm112 family)
MLVCPSCRAEFRAGFDRCKDCGVALVDPDRLEEEAVAHGTPKERLDGVQKAVIPQPSLTACRELEAALLDAGIDCYTHVEEADADVALGSAAALQYAVVFAQDAIEDAKAAMKERFQEMVESEGFGQLQTDPIDLEAEEVTCPACGTTGPLSDGECAECGLFLGAMD